MQPRERSCELPIPESRLVEILSARGYSLQGELGAGGQAVVKLCKSVRDEQQYAVKITAVSPGCVREVESLKQVYSPYIINIYEAFIDDGCFFQVLEYCSGGSLYTIAKGRGLPAQQALLYCGQLVRGLQACHARGVAHLDIKPQNALIDRYGRAKLADFGLSQATATDPAVAPRGSLFYMAPEVLAGQPFDPLKADIWSLGVTFYFIHRGKLPWPKNQTELLRIISAGFDQNDPEIPVNLGPLLRRMINASPGIRPSADEIVAHSLFSKMSLWKSSSTGPVGRLPLRARKMSRSGEIAILRIVSQISPLQIQLVAPTFQDFKPGMQ
jgi:serine/threonine protein kinase